jgi:hypothetical protein
MSSENEAYIHFGNLKLETLNFLYQFFLHCEHPEQDLQLSFIIPGQTEHQALKNGFIDKAFVLLTSMRISLRKRVLDKYCRLEFQKSRIINPKIRH